MHSRHRKTIRTLLSRLAPARPGQRGFTLIELMIVVAVIAIIASVAIPKLMAARVSANEVAAIQTLRLLSTAEAQFKAQLAIDTDSDGNGEYGYFAELAGTATMRVNSGGAPAVGTPGVDRLDPSLLADMFGTLNAQSLVARSGYMFKLWLPGAEAGGLVAGLPEAAGTGVPGVGGGAPGTGGFPDADTGEIYWCAYAWPIEAGSTGNRAFFVNQDGLLWQSSNRGATPYSGIAKQPAFDEAFVTNDDMSGNVRIGVAGGADASLWAPVQ